MNSVHLLYIKILQFQNLKKKQLYFPKSPLIHKILYILVQHGLILGFRSYLKHYYLIDLKYNNLNQGAFIFYPLKTLMFKKLSYKILLKLKNIYGIIVLTTPQGVLTHNEAILKKTGGRVIGIFI